MNEWLIILLFASYNRLRITLEHFMWNSYTIFLLILYILYILWFNSHPIVTSNYLKSGSHGKFMYKKKSAYHWIMFFPKYGNILCNIIICYRNFMNDQLHTKLLFNIQWWQKFHCLPACIYSVISKWSKTSNYNSIFWKGHKMQVYRVPAACTCVCTYKLDMIWISSSHLSSSHPTSLKPFPVFQMGTGKEISTLKWCMFCLSPQSQLYVQPIKYLIPVSCNI